MSDDKETEFAISKLNKFGQAAKSDPAKEAKRGVDWCMKILPSRPKVIESARIATELNDFGASQRR